MRWFLLLLISASGVWAQFPLSVPTRPTTFPLARPTNEGLIVGWGNNSYGQTTVPANVERPLAVAAGDPHSLAATWNGAVVAWGAGAGKEGSYPNDYRGPAVQIDATDQLSLVLTENGYIAAWGSFPGRSVPNTLFGVVQVAAGYNHGLALRPNGTVVAWGDNSYGQRNVPSTLTNVVQVAANSTSYALRSDGTVVAWGSGNYLPSGMSNIVQIAAMQAGCVLLHDDGTVTVAGHTGTNKPPGFTNVVQVDGGINCAVARLADGTVKVWNNDYGTLPNPPLGLSNVAHVSLSGSHVMAFVIPSGAPSLYVLSGQPLQHVAHQGTLTGLVAVVSNSTATSLILTNSGSADLTDLRPSIAGIHSGDFSLGQTNLAAVPPSGIAELPITFSPSGGGLRTATLSIASNDPSVPSYEINLSATALTESVDGDGDGLNDAAEYLLRDLGFDWQLAQPAFVSALFDNSAAAGLYTSNSIVTNASAFGLYTPTEYAAHFESGRTIGRADVTNAPASFNLFTQAQFDANRTAGQQDVIGSPISHGLYTSNSIMDLRMGGMMVPKADGVATVTFQPQTTTDLRSQPFTNNGAPITFDLPMPADKGFMRWKAE